MSIAADRRDFTRFIREIGLTKAQVDAAARTAEYDHAESEKVAVSKSSIQGMGVRASRPIPAERRICAAQIAGRWNTFGRYANHSKCPSAEPRMTGRCMEFFSIRALKRGDEVTVNYRLIHTLLKQSKSGGPSV